MALGFITGGSQRPSHLGTIPDGIAGVRATLGKMARIVKAYKTSLAIHELTRRLTADLPPQNVAGADAAIITRLAHFVRDQITYRNDIADVETLQTPDYTLEIQAGDCDDKAILLATMLASLGYPPMFFAVAVNGCSEFTHVLAGVKLGTRQIPLETIIPRGNPGAEPGTMPPGTSKVLPWSVG